MYSSNELKKGVIVDLDGAPHIVENTQAASGGARGGTTTYHVRCRNLKTGQRVEKSSFDNLLCSICHFRNG